MTRFSDTFGARAWDVLKGHHGLACTYTDADDASTQSLTCLFRDTGSSADVSFGLFMFERSDLTTSAEPKRGHTITDPDSNVWVITDVRDRTVTNPAMHHVEVILPLART